MVQYSRREWYLLQLHPLPQEQLSPHLQLPAISFGRKAKYTSSREVLSSWIKEVAAVDDPAGMKIDAYI